MNLSRSLLEESSSHLKDALHGRWMDNMARRESGGFYRSPARRESGGFRAESTPSPRPRAASDSTPSALHLGPSQPRKAACSLRRESSDCTGAAAARRPRQVSHARCAHVRTGGLDLGDAHEDGGSPKARKGGAGEYDGDTFDGDTFDAAAVPMARSLGTMPGLHFPRERSAGGSQARRHRAVLVPVRGWQRAALLPHLTLRPSACERMSLPRTCTQSSAAGGGHQRERRASTNDAYLLTPTRTRVAPVRRAAGRPVATELSRPLSVLRHPLLSRCRASLTVILACAPQQPSFKFLGAGSTTELEEVLRAVAHFGVSQNRVLTQLSVSRGGERRAARRGRA